MRPSAPAPPSLWRRTGAALARQRLPILLLVLIGIAWEVGGRIFGVPEYVVPRPVTIARVLAGRLPLFADHVVPTVVETLAGFALGNGIAILLAISFVYSAAMEKAIMPIAITLRSIPLVAITPLLMLILGTGYEPRIAIVAIICFFPTLVNMVRGLTAIEVEPLHLFHTLSATGWQVFLKLRFPASLPYLFSALKIAATSSVLGAIISEWIGADKGLGFLVISATFKFEADMLYATMAVSSLLAILFYLVVAAVERRVIRWHQVFVE